MSIDYEKYIINTNKFMANKINIFEASTNTRVILDVIDKEVFKNVLNYVFNNKFNFLNKNKVIIKTHSKIININEIEYDDFDFGTINYILDNNNVK